MTQRNAVFPPLGLLLGLYLVAVPAADAATILGRVQIRPDGRPANGVWVAIERVGEVVNGFPDPSAGRDDRYRSVYTDAEGKFALAKLPTGQYEVRVESDSLPLWLTTDTEPLRTVLVSESDRAEVEIEVSTLASISGRVRRHDGGALRSGVIEVYHLASTQPFATYKLDGRGRFEIPDLEPGVTVALKAISPEGMYRRIETTPLHAGPTHLDIEVPNWQAIDKKRVKMHVRVPRPGDRPLLLEWISRPLDGAQGFKGETRIDHEGNCEFESPPGIYEVRVREITREPRFWEGTRYYRVDLDEPGVHTIMVEVRETLEDGAAQKGLSAR